MGGGLDGRPIPLATIHVSQLLMHLLGALEVGCCGSLVVVAARLHVFLHVHAWFQLRDVHAWLCDDGSACGGSTRRLRYGGAFQELGQHAFERRSDG
jgi:hypothetical protein